MRQGQPVVVHGDGTSLWALTHHSDFAKAFVGLLGQPKAVGESFHITSDEVLTWNEIYTALAVAAGVEPRLVHVATETIMAVEPSLEGPLLGDKAHSVIFDNAKVRALVPGYVATTPFSTGAREIVEWHDADPSRKRVDQRMDALMDRLAERHRPSGRTALDELYA
jgi:nucleoside-diphosphate-sugar epimerase